MGIFKRASDKVDQILREELDPKPAPKPAPPKK